ncbi:MAG: hypothetical protein GYB66_05665 [Chloroflexi bacterium]|nr:hypothetical protein [Chloroflexota bacterium]
MQRIRVLSILMLLLSGIIAVVPVWGQEGGVRYNWAPPLNQGQMPANDPLLPPIDIMPVLPLEDTLIPGTLIFNVESFGEEYTTLTITLDSRLWAYNITQRNGLTSVSPNGQYGIYTVPDGALDVITCGILDLLTLETVDRFETTGGCHQSSVYWSPDSQRVLFQTRTESGVSALGIRHHGETLVYRPLPIGSADLGDVPLGDNFNYFVSGWLSAQVISFEIVNEGIVSEQLYMSLDDSQSAYPVTSLSLEDVSSRFVLSLPAQPAGVLDRGYWLTDLVTGDHFELAPPGNIARYGVVSPDGSAVVYWAASEGPLGATHPLRLVIYVPATDEQIVLLQFDGPQGDILRTRPGQLAWNPEGIFFHIEQQPGTLSSLEEGTYRIQPDGSDLTFVTPAFLWRTLPPQ